MSTVQAQPVSPATNQAAFETRAKQDGFIDADGFFTQEDWEFELDTLQDRSRAALTAHLAKGAEHDTAMFLKGYLMDSGSHFTRFED